MVKKNKRKQNLFPKQLLWPLFFQLQMTVRMKNAKENICVFFFLLFLSHTYEELLSYAPVKLSIREIVSLVGCDAALCFKLLNN